MTIIECGSAALVAVISSLLWDGAWESLSYQGYALIPGVAVHQIIQFPLGKVQAAAVIPAL